MARIKNKEINWLEQIFNALKALISAVSGQTIAAPQSDWEETDEESPAYIKNKPEIPEGGGASDTLVISGAFYKEMVFAADLSEVSTPEEVLATADDQLSQFLTKYGWEVTKEQLIDLAKGKYSKIRIENTAENCSNAVYITPLGYAASSSDLQTPLNYVQRNLFGVYSTPAVPVSASSGSMTYVENLSWDFRLMIGVQEYTGALDGTIVDFMQITASENEEPQDEVSG